MAWNETTDGGYTILTSDVIQVNDNAGGADEYVAHSPVIDTKLYPNWEGIKFPCKVNVTIVSGGAAGVLDAFLQTSNGSATTGDAYGTDAQFLDFSTWFTTAGEFIEDEEDEELAMLQINKINAYVQAYQAQNQANVSSHTHLQLRHSILVRQYESAFGMKPEE